jgi:diphthine-ammonia ligase
MSYLWQQPQLPLLDSMLHSGVQAILVKVAGVGLGINIVGKELGAVYPLLKRLVSPAVSTFDVSLIKGQ